MLLLVAGCQRPAPAPKKFVIILQAGTGSHEGGARALHALLYTQELKQGGYDTVLIFDGAGTTWAEAFRDTSNRLHGRYEELKALGVTEEICDYCAGAFKVKESLPERAGAALVKEFGGHPSLKKWIDQGYQLIVL